MTPEIVDSQPARAPECDRPARIDECDHLWIERADDHGDAYLVFTGERQRIGTIEPVSSRAVWKAVSCAGETMSFVRRAGVLGERMDVGHAADSIARVNWLALRRGYHYRIRTADGPELRVDGRHAGDFELDISADRRTIGAIEFDLRPARGDDSLRSGNGALPIRQRMIRVEPGSVSPPQRWALLAAALFAEHPPRLFAGRFGRP